jgi:hypothetical protein
VLDYTLSAIDDLICENYNKFAVSKSINENELISRLDGLSGCELLVVVPVYGRKEHLSQLLQNLGSQISPLRDKKVGVIVAEMSDSQEHLELCKRYNVGYVHSRKNNGSFNKSSIMNLAVKMYIKQFKEIPNYLLFHDVDIIMGRTWVEDCLKQAHTLDQELHGAAWICQTIKDRKVEYVSKENTDLLFSGKISHLDLDNIEHYINDAWYNGKYPPGGSIMVQSELFCAIGGYDPHLFWGYSPEDLHFLMTCQLFTNGHLHTLNTESRSYHLHHETSEATNMLESHMSFASKMLLKHPEMIAANSCVKFQCQEILPADFIQEKTYTYHYIPATPCELTDEGLVQVQGWHPCGNYWCFVPDHIIEKVFHKNRSHATLVKTLKELYTKCAKSTKHMNEGT